MTTEVKIGDVWADWRDTHWLVIGLEYGWVRLLGVAGPDATASTWVLPVMDGYRLVSRHGVKRIVELGANMQTVPLVEFEFEIDVGEEPEEGVEVEIQVEAPRIAGATYRNPENGATYTCIDEEWFSSTDRTHYVYYGEGAVFTLELIPDTITAGATHTTQDVLQALYANTKVPWTHATAEQILKDVDETFDKFLIEYTFDDYELAIDHLMYKDGQLIPPAIAALGLAGEAGEAVELVKKAEWHGKPVERDAMKKELGDVLWYLSAMAHNYGLTLAEIAKGNVAKLQARYPNGFVEGGGVR